jgi:hypothetical protein
MGEKRGNGLPSWTRNIGILSWILLIGGFTLNYALFNGETSGPFLKGNPFTMITMSLGIVSSAIGFVVGLLAGICGHIDSKTYIGLLMNGLVIVPIVLYFLFAIS